MAEKEIILELDYRISPEDFYTFSVRSMNRQYAAGPKRPTSPAFSNCWWAFWYWGM